MVIDFSNVLEWILNNNCMVHSDILQKNTNASKTTQLHSNQHGKQYSTEGIYNTTIRKTTCLHCT